MSMADYLTRWYRKYFSDPQAIALFILLLVGLLVVIYMGGILAPVFTAVILAYLLEGIIRWIECLKVPRLLAVPTVFVVFLGASVFAFFTMLPSLWQQTKSLLNELPNIVEKGKESLTDLAAIFPEYISVEQVQALSNSLDGRIAHIGQYAFSVSLSSLSNVGVVVVYLVLVPFLIFFFLKDKEVLLHWVAKYLPKDRKAAHRVWDEMNAQISNYARGKAVEILILGVVTYVTFIIFGLKYASVLAIIVGVSALIPYVGAAVATIPVALVAIFQWGWGAETGYVLLAYGVIQALDGNVLVPLLFSEALNLHPVAIIIAVLVFGGIWGFWGIFFAIPLATLVKAVINSWPVEETAT